MNVYAKEGTSLQQVGGDLPDGWVPMVDIRPSEDHIARADGTWVIAPPDSSDVDAERDRRLAAGFSHGGLDYRSRAEDRASITENANLAAMAIMNGAQKGDLDWLADGEEFKWITADNERVPMDAYAMIDLARSAATHKNKLVFAARALKDMSPIPADYADEKYWS